MSEAAPVRLTVKVAMRAGRNGSTQKTSIMTMTGLLQQTWVLNNRNKTDSLACSWRIVISPIIRRDFLSCYDSVMRDLVVLLIHFIASLAGLPDLAVPVPSLPSRFCSSINS